MPGSNWTDWLLELLCRLYKAWGGDCKDFDGQPSQAITRLTDTFAREGAPLFVTPQERVDFLKKLDETEECLAMPENSLTSKENATLTQFIIDVRHAVQ